MIERVERLRLQRQAEQLTVAGKNVQRVLTARGEGVGQAFGHPA